MTKQLYLSRCSGPLEDISKANKRSHWQKRAQQQHLIPDPSEIRSMQGNGKSLSESDQRFFNSRFGYDFSQVRIHANNQSAGIARSIQARAFTIGNDMAFGAGQYTPNTQTGRKLLTHELTHVVQQDAANSMMIQREVEGNSKQEKPWVKDYYYDTREIAEKRLNALKRKKEWQEYRIQEIKVKGVAHWQVEVRGKKVKSDKSSEEKVSNENRLIEETPNQDTSIKKSKHVCLTFDDGPQKGTEEVLDVLGSTIPATFFLTGKNMASNAKEQKRIVERMINEGHKIGNHTYTHSPMTTKQYQKAYGNLSDPTNLAKFNKNYQDNEDHFRQLLGANHPVFTLARLPGNGRFVKVKGKLIYVAQTEKLGLKHVGWDFEFALNGVFGHLKELDWQGITGVAGMKGFPKSGAIILFHDRHWKGSKKALFQAIVDKFKTENFTFGQLSNDGKCEA